MPYQEDVITIFVGSPTDVNSERDTLEKVVQEINQTWSRELKVRFDLVRWETHGHPDIGDDAQDVLNEQLPQDYDIFIGIMWHRFGTPTNRANSGTEEEFIRAKKRFESDPGSIKVMFYFKDAPIPPSKLEPDQLSKVLKFKSSLGEEGVLHWTFKENDEFERFCRIHLTKKIQSYQKDEKRTDVKKKKNKTQESEIDENSLDDVGFIELIDQAENSFTSLTEITLRISDYTHDVADNMNKRTKEINDLTNQSIGNVSRKTAKRLISKAANDLNQYAERMETEYPLFSRNLNEGIDSIIKATKLSVDFETSDSEVSQLHENLDSVKKLNSSIFQTIPHIKDFRDTIDNLPRITSDINKAKRKTVNILDNYLDEFDTGLRLTSEAEQIIQGLINN